MTNDQPNITKQHVLKGPTVLVILDGWGVAPPSRGNAITQARTPVFNKLVTTYPAMTIQASGEAVGLAWGEMGNSEIGHLNIGAGRIIYRSSVQITYAIGNRSFFSNKKLLQACQWAKKNNSKLHLIGLLSNGGVHSTIEHIYALLELAKEQKVDKVFLHIFLDGRDTVYNSGYQFIEGLRERLREFGIGAIATIAGRFYAMDRDNHWERTELVYRAMTEGISEQKTTDALKIVKESYAKKIYDEEFKPTVVTENKQPVAIVEDKDAVIFFNFRADRARQLTKAFVLPGFAKFSRKKYLSDLFFVTMTEYDKDLPVLVAFTEDNIEHHLSQAISEAGLKQLHIAETEKYAHITYFLKGGNEKKLPGETDIIIPSPRVASYATKPEMSARQVANQVVKAITANQYDFIVVNFANPDMVARTGDLMATIKAVQTIDKCLGNVIKALLAKDGSAIVIADHGNAEELINLQTGEIDKEHSTFPVPFIVVSNELEGKNAGGPAGVGADLSLTTSNGFLADVAPTILKIMGLPKPAEMTGTSLI